MAYKDKDKQKEYQRNWVRQKRGLTSKGSTDIRPKVEPDVIPKEPAQQSYNPAMVGYVPPGGV